jgi:antitoxin ParD1/3/4
LLWLPPLPASGNAPMPTRNINLTDHLDDFVSQEINAGRYRNASEVMRAGLRLLELRTREDEEKLAALQKIAADGFRQLDQGEGVELRGRRELAAYIGRLGRPEKKPAKRRAKGA